MLNKVTSYLKVALKLFHHSTCYLCLGESRSGALCGFCRRAFVRAAPLTPDRLEALGLDQLSVNYLFTSPLNRVIRAYKTEGQHRLAGDLIRLYPRPKFFKSATLIPVPTLDVHVQARGEDPLRRLALGYAKRHALPLLEVKRMGPPRQQRGRAARSRREAPPQFRSPPVSGPVIIFDDVMTTGATLKALAAALREAGAGSVEAVVLAMTPPRSYLKTD